MPSFCCTRPIFLSGPLRVPTLLRPSLHFSLAYLNAIVDIFFVYDGNYCASFPIKVKRFFCKQPLLPGDIRPQGRPSSAILGVSVRSLPLTSRLSAFLKRRRDFSQSENAIHAGKKKSAYRTQREDVI